MRLAVLGLARAAPSRLCDSFYQSTGMGMRNDINESSGSGRRLPPSRLPDVTKPIIPPPVDKRARRHAAITKLPNLNSYRSWVDQIRKSWEERK